MKQELKQALVDGFSRYFPGAELPVAFFFAGELTFAAPMRKLEGMIADLEESFVITHSWQKVMRRLERS